MREVVIKIRLGSGGDRPAELFEREGGKLTSVGVPGTMRLTDEELARYEGLLSGNTPPAGLRAEGEALYLKLRGALGQPLDDLLNGEQARIFLDLEHDLHRLPWEVMIWRKPTDTGGSVATWVSLAHHVCRVIRPDWASAPQQPQGPLRVLIAIGRDDASVEAGKEEEEIRRRVQCSQRTVDIETITPRGIDELYDRIKEFVPHVLHFIGHGSSDGEARLEFQGWDLTSTNVTSYVGRDNLNKWRPGLVFLNACRTASASGQSAAMAGAFLANGASASIAMQGNIRGKAAGTLAGVFYEKLACGIPVNEALSLARGVVQQKYDYKEATYPALTLRCRPRATLPSFLPLDDDYRLRQNTCRLLPWLSVFVNQVKPRRDLCGSFWPFHDSELQRRFVLLRGHEGFGKTLLSAWALDLSLRLGHRVRYIRVGAGRDGVDYIRVLRLIWGLEQPDFVSPLTDPLPHNPDLVRLLERSKDTGVYLPFRQALAEMSAQRPLTIVLDEFDMKMDYGSFWTLWEHLFVPLATGDVFKNVHLMLVLNEKEYLDYKIDEEVISRPQLQIPGRKEIKLDMLGAEEFIDRFREYLYFRSEEFRRDDMVQFVDIWVAKLDDSIKKQNNRMVLSVAQFEDLVDKFSKVTLVDIEKVN